MPSKAIINDLYSAASPIPNFSSSPQVSNPAVHNRAYLSLTIRSYSLPAATFPSPALTIP